MINLPTKFEVPIFTRYRNMKGIAKSIKWGGLELPMSLKIGPFDTVHMSSSFLLAFRSNSCIVSET